MLYKIAYGEWLKFNFVQHENTVLLDLKKPADYVQPEDINQYDAWSAMHKYSYKLRVPPEKAGKLFVIMQQDLNRYFDLSARIEKRKLKSFVLIRTGKKNVSVPGIANKSITHLSNDLGGSQQHLPFNDLVGLLHRKFDNESTPQPFFNGTGYSGNCIISIDTENWNAWDTGNLMPLRKELKKYGLDIIEKRWLADVLIIRDKK